MTEDEALAKFEEIMRAHDGDVEVQHSNADGLLLKALRSLGWNRLADKWVAASDYWWWA